MEVGVARVEHDLRPLGECRQPNAGAAESPSVLAAVIPQVPGDGEFPRPSVAEPSPSPLESARGQLDSAAADLIRAAGLQAEDPIVDTEVRTHGTLARSQGLFRNTCRESESLGLGITNTAQ